jgi:hypothetical protein
MTHSVVTDLAGVSLCDDCDWTYVSPVGRGSDAVLMAAVHTNAPDGHPVDGCEPVFTDCCDVPRWECQTFVVLDGAGDPDVRTCVAERGCRA